MSRCRGQARHYRSSCCNIALTSDDTFSTAQRAMQVRGPMTKTARNKIETARRIFSEQVDQAALLEAIDVSFGDAVQVFHIGPASCGIYGAPAGVCEERCARTVR